MSRSIAVIIIILIMIVGGFAYIHYNQFTQVYQDLKEKDVLLEDSQRTIEQQERSIVQLEERITDISREITKNVVDERNSGESTRDLAGYQKELEELRNRIAEINQEDETVTQILLGLQQEKDQLAAHLEEKQSLLEDSQRTIEQQERSLVQLEERITDISQEITQSRADKEETEKLQDDLAGYQKELEELRNRIAEINQEDETVTQILLGLQQEKDQLAELLKEKETEWLNREEDQQKRIASLQTEVQKYEENLKDIGHEVIFLRQDLSENFLLKENLRQEFEEFKTEMNQLKEALDYYQKMEKGFEQDLIQLQADKQELETQLRESEENKHLEQDRYQQLVVQLDSYQEELKRLESVLKLAREKEESIIRVQMDRLKREKEVIEKILREKISEWALQNQDNQELISLLKNQLTEYHSEIEQIHLDRHLLQEELQVQKNLQQDMLNEIQERGNMISELLLEIEKYAESISQYETKIDQSRNEMEQQINLSLEEQQKMLDELIFWVEERENAQNRIYQCNEQVDLLRAEIEQLQERIAALEEDESQFYEVKSGDCLWRIAQERYSDGIAWVKIFNANQGIIQNPDLIYPYQKIVLPE